jgi:oxygen-independent coproporphyrinogen-3 oxidase
VRRHVPVEEYLESLRRELTLRFPGKEAWPLETLYLGGGTPSRLGGSGIARLLDVLRDRLSIETGAEVTLEANPEDVSTDSASAWRREGINRLSIGAQSFDDSALRWMHRTHDAAAIRRAVDSARDAGLTDLSLDLIFALPPEVPRSWDHDVTEALALDPTHVSLYGLTVEPLTPLGRWRERGALGEIPDDQYEREYLRAHDAMTAAGFEHYEVSNFARPGHRARHNAAYWRGVPYAGLGPGAHEYDGEVRRWSVGAYAAWVRRLAAGVDPIEGSELLDAENRETEAIYLGLRTDGGVRLSEAGLARIAPWCSAGWGTIHDGRLVLTALGWLRLDSLATDLTVVRSR